MNIKYFSLFLFFIRVKKMICILKLHYTRYSTMPMKLYFRNTKVKFFPIFSLRCQFFYSVVWKNQMGGTFFVHQIKNFRK